MSKQASETNKKPNNNIPKLHHRRPISTLFSPKISVLLLAACGVLFVLYQIQSLQTLPPSPTSDSLSSWPFTMHRWQNLMIPNATHCAEQLKSASAKLRRAVTFLPLKDLRYSQTAQEGHTWFMSSNYDTQEQGEVQYQHFPSRTSGDNRLLCLKGRDGHDGVWNSYAFAWRDSLPPNATLVNGLTFVSNNHYNYDNIWHGLSALFPFVAWHIKNGCRAGPDRWVLYHWGEIRSRVGPWLRNLMEATFNGSLEIEVFDRGYGEEESPACFEEAVVMRHNEGGMSRQRRVEVYDLMRCKARAYCNVSGDREKGSPAIGMTMFMRTGPRSFSNLTAVVGIFERECRKVEGCRLMVAQSNNLTFCDQVKLMSLTDILISPHGAQLTNMFLMDRNSSVLEFFPKGWLKLAGVGQYVYHWIASWSGMKHQGAWRDTNGTSCPYPEDDRRCMNIYKSGMIGHNETYFGEWASSVLNEVKLRKVEEASLKNTTSASPSICACG